MLSTLHSLLTRNFNEHMKSSGNERKLKNNGPKMFEESIWKFILYQSSSCLFMAGLESGYKQIQLKRFASRLSDAISDSL